MNSVDEESGVEINGSEPRKWLMRRRAQACDVCIRTIAE